jgi:hypothetical protein
MKRIGLAIPGYALDKQGNLLAKPKRLSDSERIRRKTSKRVSVKRGKRVKEDLG